MVSIRLYSSILFLVFAFTFFECYGAGSPDSLREKNYKYLFTRIRKLRQDPKAQHAYLEAFLTNAKAAKDWELIMNGYKNYADYADGKQAIIYSDSMVAAAKRSGDEKLIGSAYLSKGIIYYTMKRHELALENYLLAKPYIDRSGDDYHTFKLRYNIAHEKYYLGKNQEAIQLFLSCLEYYQENTPRAYLNTLHSLGLVYSKAGDYDKSMEMVRRGKDAGDALSDHSMDALFVHLEGINEYFKGNFASAVGLLKDVIPVIAAEDDFANVAVANFYIGKSLWQMKKYSESINYLQEVDRAFIEKEYIRPDLKESFELLLDYYKQKGDIKQISYYVDQLLSADSLLTKTHDKLYENIHTNYDTSELQQEKQKIQKLLEQERGKKTWLFWTSSLLSVSSAYLFFIWYKNREQYRAFRQLMDENKKDETKVKKRISKKLEMPQETAENIFHLLDKWEKGERFLDQNITLAKLAVVLGTNTRYASEVILYYRHKSFSDYINDLKVDYIIGKMKSDKNVRLYSHDALAKEAGFSTTKRFVEAFKSRTGISPKFFSAKIIKEMNDNGTIT